MTKFKTLDDLPADLSGKVALVRVDLNLPMKDGSATDVTRVEAAKPTILELADKGAKVLLLAHFGRPKGEKVPEMSLKPNAAPFAKVLGHPVSFFGDCKGADAKAGFHSPHRDTKRPENPPVPHRPLV